MLDPIAEGGSLFIPFLHTAERSFAALEKERTAIKRRYGAAFAVQLGLYGCVFIACPGYIIPFLNYCPGVV